MFGNENILATLIPVAAFFGIMYFFLIRPQKKREKEVKEMRESIQVGDEIVTIGGILGKVVKTKDETFVLQTNADRVKIELYRWGVSKVLSTEELDAIKKNTTAKESAPQKKKKAPRMLGKKKEADSNPNMDPAQEEGK